MRLDDPYTLAVDRAGNLYIADLGNVTDHLGFRVSRTAARYANPDPMVPDLYEAVSKIAWMRES